MYASPTMQICKRKDENTVSDTFDSYYDLQPYHSFRELEFYEGKIPLEEDDLPVEFLTAMESGDLIAEEDLNDLRLLYEEDTPPSC